MEDKTDSEFESPPPFVVKNMSPEYHPDVLAKGGKVRGENVSEISFQILYRKMFHAIQAGNTELADATRVQIEDLRQQSFRKPSQESIDQVKPQLTNFALLTLNRTQTELDSIERSNCINAAFNFHDRIPRWNTYSTLEFLERIKDEVIQIPGENDFRFGDLVVMWSRSGGGSWDSRPIYVHEINRADADFPYGLVFDHVAVRVSEDLVFHKPDPTPSSAYRIDFLDSVIAPTVLNPGFEMTFHRKA